MAEVLETLGPRSANFVEIILAAEGAAESAPADVAMRRAVFVQGNVGPEWVRQVQSWRPWRVLTPLLPGEGVESWPVELREIALWMPPLVPRTWDVGSMRRADRVLVVVDSRHQRVTSEQGITSAALSPGCLGAPVIQEVLGSLEFTVVEAGRLAEELSAAKSKGVCGLVIAARDPMLAHLIWRIAAMAGLPCLNLSCAGAAGVRAMDGAVAPEKAPDRGLRALLSPLLGWARSANRRPAFDAWPVSATDWVARLIAEGADEESGQDLLTVARKMIRVRGDPLQTISDFVASKHGDDASSTQEAVAFIYRATVCDFLMRWRNHGWAGVFADQYARAPDWLNRCREAGEINAAAGAVDPLGAIALGMIEGVCARFATGWRAPLFREAVDLWARDRRTNRISEQMRCEELKARATLMQTDEVTLLLKVQDRWPKGLLHQMVWMCLREIMPGIERGGVDLSLRPVMAAMQTWIGREALVSHESEVFGLWSLLDVYAGNHQVAMDRLQGPDAVEWNAVLGIWLWVLGNETAARTCASRLASTSALSSISRLSLAALHALIGSSDESVRLLESIRERDEKFCVVQHRNPDTRWLFLGLTAKALGATDTAALFRERARTLHPHGELRDRLFDRVHVREADRPFPPFATE